MTSEECYNTEGSFECVCKQGFFKNGQDKCIGIICINIYIRQSSWTLGFRLAPGAAQLQCTGQKIVGGLAFWSAHADSQGTALTGGWMDQG